MSPLGFVVEGCGSPDIALPAWRGWGWGPAAWAMSAPGLHLDVHNLSDSLLFLLETLKDKQMHEAAPFRHPSHFNDYCETSELKQVQFRNSINTTRGIKLDAGPKILKLEVALRCWTFFLKVMAQDCARTALGDPSRLRGQRVASGHHVEIQVGRWGSSTREIGGYMARLFHAGPM